MRFAELQEILVREFGADIARRACAAICREASGEQVKIPRRDLPPEIRPDDTPKTLQARYQVSRSTAYNWVSQWRQ
jgi:hypothetical protein